MESTPLILNENKFFDQIDNKKFDCEKINGDHEFINALNIKGMNILFIACRNSASLKTIRVLIEKGADYNATYKGVSLFKYACAHSSLDIVKFLFSIVGINYENDIIDYMFEKVSKKRVWYNPFSPTVNKEIIYFLLENGFKSEIEKNNHTINISKVVDSYCL